MMENLLINYTKKFEDGVEYLPHRGPITVHQRVFFLLGAIATCFGLWRLWNHHTNSSKEPENQKHDEENATFVNVEEGQNKPSNPPIVKPRQFPPITNDDALKHVIIIFAVLSYYFLCDYIHYFPRGPRIYNRDLFAFLILLLVIVNVIYTGKTSTDIGADKLLNRDQTEEWKGWMQVMFVWYHYYHAIETYNLIRLFIACYVWMTGFGNFSFYWVRKDFSIRRIFNSLFRLNFLVLLACMVTNNSYMLYYICAMHTFWYLSVFAMMRPFHQYNDNPRFMAMKLAIYFGVVFVVFDIPGVSTALFKPFQFVLGYDNSIHEWVFRSTLDHYATFVGMLCAYFHPNVESFLRRYNDHPKGNIVIGCIGVVLLSISYVWYEQVFVLDKFAYNKLHPYTFFIPMVTYIFLRNATPSLRRWNCGLFGYLGKITLETYISQLHVYLIQDAKGILVYFPHYPMLNFLINSFIYVCLSNALFRSTIALNAYIFPSDAKKMWKNIAMIIGGFVLAYIPTYAFTVI